jgi:hypothetical protein
MSLDIKREEIAKLEQKASQKEEALKKSELMLEEDAIRFDAFLKENDQQAHDALKRAEAQAKAKAEKMHDLKKLKHAIGLVAAEKGKLKEVLDDYKRYQQFLDALTPADWTAEILRQRAERTEAERVRRYEAKQSDWEAARTVKEAEVMAQAEMQRRQALKAGKVPPKVDVAAVVAQALPPMPTLEGEPRPTECVYAGRRGVASRRWKKRTSLQTAPLPPPPLPRPSPAAGLTTKTSQCTSRSRSSSWISLRRSAR